MSPAAPASDLGSVPTRPSLTAVVPAALVEGKMTEALRTLEALRQEAAHWVAEAERREAAVASRATDLDAESFMAVRLGRFLDELRAEADRDLQSLFDAAASLPGPRAARVADAVDVGARPTVFVGFAPIASCRVDSSPVSGAIQTAEVVDAGPDPGLALDRFLESGPEIRDAVHPVAASDDEHFWGTSDVSPRLGHFAWRTTRALVLQVAAVLAVVGAVLVRVG